MNATEMPHPPGWHDPGTRRAIINRVAGRRMSMNQKKMQAFIETVKRQARESANREKAGITSRLTMLFCYSMLQCGFSADDVNKVKLFTETVAANKFIELRNDGVAEAWLREQLEADGVHFDPIPEQDSIDDPF